jgi:cytochrome P450
MYLLSNIESHRLTFIILGAKFKRHAAATLPLFRRGKIISNFDLIIDCTDKLLENWRNKSQDHIHTDIIQQSQNLLLQIFGLIAFDYNLETLEHNNENKKTNELTQALNSLLNAVDIVFYAPKIVSIIYLKLHPRYQRARRTIEKYLNQMIEQELGESSKSRSERKRTCLIASLVDSLQNDEKIESMKKEEDRKGKSFL